MTLGAGSFARAVQNGVVAVTLVAALSWACAGDSVDYSGAAGIGFAGEAGVGGAGARDREGNGGNGATGAGGTEGRDAQGGQAPADTDSGVRTEVVQPGDDAVLDGGTNAGAGGEAAGGAAGGPADAGTGGSSVVGTGGTGDIGGVEEESGLSLDCSAGGAEPPGPSSVFPAAGAVAYPTDSDADGIADVCRVRRGALIAAGTSHVCAIDPGGSVACWGLGFRGQLGDGRARYQSSPVLVSGLSDAIGIAVGANHSCAVTRGGSVSCWGFNLSGELGVAVGFEPHRVPVPVLVAGAGDAVEVATGASHSCALRRTGQIVCWGAGFRGELGNGTSGPDARHGPELVQGINDAVALSAGGSHICAVRQNGRVMCWGSNFDGRLGDGTVTDRSVPVEVLGVQDAIGIAAGGNHSCALRQGGQVSCWGEVALGRLGNPDAVAQPVAVAGLTDAISISAGAFHTCAVRQSGSVTCWGDGGNGQLGIENADERFHLTPVVAEGLEDAIAISAGSSITCATRGNGQVSCFGLGGYGELGNGFFRYEPFAVAVPGASDIRALSAGAEHTCLVRQSGSMLCFGRGDAGQLGNGTTDTRYLPSAVSDVTDATAVAAGGAHTCAVRSGGTVACWGDGSAGQLGTGLMSSTLTPVAVLDLVGAVDIVAGPTHSCALFAGGEVSCWGTFGPNAIDKSPAPVNVPTLTDAVDITASQFATCAVRASGEVTCWTDTGAAPEPIPGLTDAVRIASGGEHACAVLQNREMWCWGSNARGQLGMGSLLIGSSTTAVPVAHTFDAVDVTAGLLHTCAAKADGSVTCWGDGIFGQLGNGEVSQARRYDSPVSAIGLTEVTAISAGQRHTCALRQNGEVVCYGNGDLGQRGNGFETERVPTRVAGIPLQ